MTLIESIKEIRRDAKAKQRYREKIISPFDESDWVESLRYILLSVIQDVAPLLREWYGGDAVNLGYSSRDALLSIEWQKPVVLDLSEKGEVFFIDLKNPNKVHQIMIGSNWDYPLICSEFGRFFLFFISELCHVAPESRPIPISCVICAHCQPGKDDNNFPYSFYSCARGVYAKASDSSIESNTNCSLFEKQS